MKLMLAIILAVPLFADKKDDKIADLEFQLSAEQSNRHAAEMRSERLAATLAKQGADAKAGRDAAQTARTRIEVAADDAAERAKATADTVDNAAMTTEDIKAKTEKIDQTTEKAAAKTETVSTQIWLALIGALVTVAGLYFQNKNAQITQMIALNSVHDKVNQIEAHTNGMQEKMLDSATQESRRQGINEGRNQISDEEADRRRR